MTDQPGGDGQPTSYAEKYRGTEWGRPDPSPPPPSSGSRQPLLVALVAVVLIGAVGVGLAAFAMSPDRPSISSLATPSSNPDRVDSGAPATSLSPTPTADPGLAIKAKFWTLASDPAASYHLDGAGRSVFDRATFETFKESLDVVGDEYSGTLTSRSHGILLQAIQPSRIASARIARKGGIIWLKEPGTPRTSARSSERSERLTPFLYLDLPGEIDYVKPVLVGGRQLHLLRTNRYYRPAIARMIDTIRFDAEPDDMTLDIYVTDDGVPVSATFSVLVSGHDDMGKHHTFRAQTDFRFSRFGAKVAIRIPRR